MDLDEARTIGRRVRQVRKSRRKRLEVVAGLAGMSKSKLDRIERGEVALDKLSDIVALAGVLQIAPSDLMRLPVPAPGNGHTDSTTEAVRLALDAVEVGQPGGLVLPVAVLRERVAQISRRSQACEFAEVASALPGLIRDLHTTLDTGRDHGELLGLAVYLHVEITRMWLNHAFGPADLRRRVVFLARRLAHEHGELNTLGVATFGVADDLTQTGTFDLALAELDEVTLPATTADTAGMITALIVVRATLAAVTGQLSDADAPMEAAAELAGRFGEVGESDPLAFGFGPTNVGFRKVRLALEADQPDQAVRIAEGLHPEQNPSLGARVYHWVGYGRALARLRGRQDDAVIALRTAERLFPTRVQRDPLVREAFAGLLYRSRRDAVGKELRGMAYRAGLPV